MTANIIALHACILFFSSVISIPHVKWIMVTLNSLRPVGYGYGWNGYGFLLPAGCWVEVAELAAACWGLVTRSPGSTAPYRCVNESISSGVGVGLCSKSLNFSVRGRPLMYWRAIKPLRRLVMKDRFWWAGFPVPTWKRRDPSPSVDYGSRTPHKRYRGCVVTWTPK